MKKNLLVELFKSMFSFVVTFYNIKQRNIFQKLRYRDTNALERKYEKYRPNFVSIDNH